jgi:uncharacterized protein
MFWDSSALVPLLLPEASSPALTKHLRTDPAPAFWWASPVECRSALHRRHREGLLSDRVLSGAIGRLDALVQAVDTVPATDAVLARAGRLLAAHPLSAAAALQLAAALAWCEEATDDETLVCLDRRLGEAARREGFTLMPD